MNNFNLKKINIIVKGQVKEQNDNYSFFPYGKPLPNSLTFQLPTDNSKMTEGLNNGLIRCPTSELTQKNGSHKKIQKSNRKDYRKNICGYITKKVLREFLSSSYAQNVRNRCELQGVSYQKVVQYYERKIQQITGPSHIPFLIIPNDESEVKIKKVFFYFFEWFLKNRYMRCLLGQGKMSNKKAYIQYKNYNLLHLLDHKKNLLQIKQIQLTQNNLEHKVIVKKQEQ